MDARTRLRTQLVGALPAIVHYFDELDLAATIDRLVPGEGDVPLGTLVEVLVANRLLQPKALYALKTNLPGRTHPLAEVLRSYKGQSRVERRFHHLKGPLAVAPMFLKNPDRIAGLLCVLV